MDRPQPNSDAKRNLPNHLKASLLIAASSFLAYSVYWAAFSVNWLYIFTTHAVTLLRTLNIFSPLQQSIIILQEYAASAGYFLALIGAIFALQSTISYIKNQEKHRDRLGWALIFVSTFFLMLIPSSIHHLLGSALSWPNVNFYVGLSFLLQALLIAPPLIILGHNLRKPQNQNSILKWTAISGPLVVFAFWVKYLLFWVATLSPLGPKQATVASTVGAVNSAVTLLLAAVITSAACIILYRKREVNTSLAGSALVLLGGFFVIYGLVSLWVPVYSSFFYLTDFWMMALPILGITVLKTNHSP